MPCHVDSTLDSHLLGSEGGMGHQHPFAVKPILILDLVVGSEPAEISADRTGRAALGEAEDLPSEEHYGQKNSCTEYYSIPSIVHPAFLRMLFVCPS